MLAEPDCLAVRSGQCEIVLVAMDGGCDPVVGQPWAEWGFVSRNLLFVLMSDSQYVERGARALLRGVRISGKLGDLWTVRPSGIHKVAGVTWVKAHLMEAKLAARGIPRSHWALKREAEAQATFGVRSHVEVPGARALWTYRGRRSAEWQRYLLR